MRRTALLRLVVVVPVIGFAGACRTASLPQPVVMSTRPLPPGQAKKQVTPATAVVVSREVLVKHGFTIVRVEQVGPAQVIYYRSGNHGRGRGQGKLEKMVVRPSGTVVVFETTPAPVLADIKIRLGL
jgi:hypothetical protein